MKTTLVPTKETCQALQEAGFDIDTEFYWQTDTGEAWGLEHGKYEAPEMTNVPAPLLSEALEVMPAYMQGEDYQLTLRKQAFTDDDEFFSLYYGDQEDYMPDGFDFYDHEKPAEAASRLLLRLAEEGHVNPEDV